MSNFKKLDELILEHDLLDIKEKYPTFFQAMVGLLTEQKTLVIKANEELENFKGESENFLLAIELIKEGIQVRNGRPHDVEYYNRRVMTFFDKIRTK